MTIDLKFHHLGLAVNKEDRALRFLTGMDYVIGDKIYDPEQNVHLRLCCAETAPNIEIIMPGKGDGPLTSILKKYDELFYHSCYEVDDLEIALKQLETNELRVFPVASPKPAVLFAGRRVSFYKVAGFGLIELLEQPL